MKHKLIGVHEIGTFNVNSGKVEITDPCYSPESGIVVNNVKNGTYLSFVDVVDAGNWGSRNAILYAINKEYFDENQLKVNELNLQNWDPQNDYFGVDSGQGGIFDVSKFLGGDNEEFYDECCSITLNGIGAHTLDGGVVSSSGFGDGGYGYQIIKNAKSEIVAISLIFIDDDPEEIEDEDEDE